MESVAHRPHLDVRVGVERLSVAPVPRPPQPIQPIRILSPGAAPVTTSGNATADASNVVDARLVRAQRNRVQDGDSLDGCDDKVEDGGWEEGKACTSASASPPDRQDHRSITR
jgi:hypothetical protein